MSHHPPYPFTPRHIQALALLSLIGATLGALGSHHWLAELFSHFWAWYGAFFALAILFARSHRQRLAWLIPTLFSAYWLFTPLPITINISAQQTHRALWYNVNLDNPNPAAQIARENSVLVLGDLNATPFSPVFRDFIATAGLHNAMTNITPTWFLFGLHLDHALHRQAGNVQTTALPWGSSDHCAILVERQF